MYIKPASWIEISKSAFDHNIAIYKSITKAHTKIAIVIKSNAYGHDTSTMAKLCQQNSEIDYVCTNSLSEALLARDNGLTKNILVISLIDEDPLLAIDHDIDLISYNIKQIQELNKIGSRAKKPVAIHLKVDTGMSRLGFLPNELLEVIDRIINLPYVYIKGIFTHFAESSNANTEYSQYQIKQFTNIIDMLEKKGLIIPLKHIANTAGVPITRTCQKANMIRLGAGAFGFYSSKATHTLLKTMGNQLDLIPILTWKTRILTIKKIPENRFVGYGRTYKTKHEMILGYLPIGYADGLDKQLNNKGVVYLPKYNSLAPIIGQICMNMTIVDLSGVKNICENEEVILIGKRREIHAQHIDQMINSESAREVTARITSSFPRIIVP